MRTVLSLLGVTVGIFAIISVFTIVDSLEKNVKESFSFLGSDVLYVSKQPFVIKSRDEWLSYRNRPNPDLNDFKSLKNRLTKASSIAIYTATGNVMAKRNSNSYNEGVLQGVSFEYNNVQELDIVDGRYFSRSESNTDKNVVILGYNVMEALFPLDLSPVGETIKIKGLKFVVIGVLAKEGESFFGFSSKDDNIMIPYNSFRKIVNTGKSRSGVGSTIILTGSEEDIGLIELEQEIMGVLRASRGLKPREVNNFEINRPEAISNAVSGVFDVLGMAGWIIGGFSILVGGFGIANIMFVSVKERTHIIGIQKSLGAKNYFVLFQFLFESIFLSVIGGLGGLILVWLITFIPMGSLEVTLTLKNITLGLGVSAIIGTVSGIVPAALAARLDPVIAIRS